MSEKKTIRIVLLLLLATGVLGAVSVVVGFYSLRNTTLRDTSADDMAPIYCARGMQLSPEQAEKLEQDVKSDPGSFADRIELLAFYNAKIYQGGLQPEELANRRAHILWIIEHEPASKFASSPMAAFEVTARDPEGIEQADKLWLQQVQARPRDARILYNAGRFFFWVHNTNQSEELLERAYAIEPANHDIASSLAGLYWTDATRASSAAQVAATATKALGVFEQALRDAHDPRERLNDLPDAAQAAFEAGDYDRAATYAKEVLSLAEQPEYADRNGDAVHYGNTVLGRIALRNGDTATATAHLLKSAAISGNPHLDTYGPNMMLAKELLEKGERKSVLEYFDRCGKFWTEDDGKLEEWRSAVLSGKNPDFGDNLRY
jgi:tetratricopeptide (TPR) repeat protein